MRVACKHARELLERLTKRLLSLVLGEVKLEKREFTVHGSQFTVRGGAADSGVWRQAAALQ
jgi:hypothetical protein